MKALCIGTIGFNDKVSELSDMKVHTFKELQVPVQPGASHRFKSVLDNCRRREPGHQPCTLYLRELCP